MRDILNSAILFRDYETSGLNSFYDQVLTSSAKRYFNGQIVDEMYLTARCESHRLPSPLALFINGVTSAELENGLPLNSLMQLDHDFNNKYSNDFICCYNSKFDFNFSYCGYFQQLVSPDIYQWKKKHQLLCCLELIRAVYAFNLDSKIQFPLDLFASPNFSLERLCAENGITYLAHNAAQDVDATIQVFEMIKQDSPDLVRHAMMHSSKRAIQDLIQKNDFFCAAIGTGKNMSGRSLVPILSFKKGSELLCLDISQADPRKLSNLNSWEISKQLRRNSIDDLFVLVPINKQKVIFGTEQYQACYPRSQKNIEELRERSLIAREDNDLIDVCKKAYELFEITHRTYVDGNLELQIFDSFIDHNEAKFIRQFNLIDWKDRLDFIKNNDLIESTNRCSRIAMRLVIENFPSSVPNDIVESYNLFCNQRLFNLGSNQKVKWVHISRVLSELNELRERFTDQELRLKELEEYFDSRLATSP
ncbi:hypothetical protein N9V24_01065 [Pseudomonadota bacterium]|nr:hypothetical protein [Pseudomonadota bacterium]